LVVASLDISYKAPAKLDDQLMVTAELVQLKRVSMVLKQTVLRGEELITIANINLVTVSKDTLRPIAIPQSLTNHPLLTRV
jgi:YbgC/YbaW family acyl-CoA thioester hydrolase